MKTRDLFLVAALQCLGIFPNSREVEGKFTFFGYGKDADPYIEQYDKGALRVDAKAMGEKYRSLIFSVRQ